MNLVDKGIELIAPVHAVKREAARQVLKRNKILNRGYGEHGASSRKKAFKGWLTSLGGPKTDIYEYKDKLVERSRDLYMGAPLARGALQTMQTNIVGAGLKLKSAIDVDILETDETEIEALENRIEKQMTR